MMEGKFAAAAGIDNHIAISQQALDKADVEDDILYSAERPTPATLGPERSLVYIDNILPVQDILIVLMLLANPEDPTDGEEPEGQPEQERQAWREQSQADHQHHTDRGQ